ncbi:FAD-dependent oxidoreductase, partial [Burkholderia sp. Ac-20379]|nr:FAD-dependent oxidoreductase [Burkholderia sp. Ac-20379]
PVGVRPLLVTGRGAPAPAVPGALVVEDRDGIVAQRFDARPGTFYLLRPDQHVCARWRALDVVAVSAALDRATCNR